ncbi:MAG: protease modulator HflC [Candidatus Neomarinimicrobiota bacterium]|nr:protease modulator HflC [Candidatus Neomarinimicrobiota bacterium]RKY51378.1 MAG: protease modulator HflC [Candidatus Neomarinimicrobiota bacterium]
MKKLLFLILLIIIGVGLYSSIFIVNETEQVIKTRFGKPIGEAITAPGIHFKVPILDVLHYFDKRYLEWDGRPNQIPTKDKRFIWVDTYARWHITDPLKFYQRLYNEQGAHSRLDDIIDGETRNAVASHNLIEIVRKSNRESMIDSTALDEIIVLEEIEVGREKIGDMILKNAQKRCEDLGIEILDFEFKRINYVQEVQEKVFERMISERKRIADRYRSEGQGEASRIQGERERELLRIRSEAYRKAQEIKGKADAEATAIYNLAYNQSSESRKFYEFMKTMETYQNTIDSSTTVILSTKSKFYKYLKSTGDL